MITAMPVAVGWRRLIILKLYAGAARFFARSGVLAYDFSEGALQLSYMCSCVGAGDVVLLVCVYGRARVGGAFVSTSAAGSERKVCI